MRPLRSAFVVIACAAVAVGCGVGWVRKVETRAPGELQCPTKQVELVERASGTVVAQGCGRTVVYQCYEPSESCDNLTEVARARANRDTGCAPDLLRVAEIQPHQFQVQGCGVRKVYLCEMKGGATTCVNETNL